MENKLINFKVIRIISLALQLFNCFLLMLLVWKYCTSWGVFCLFFGQFFVFNKVWNSILVVFFLVGDSLVFCSLSSEVEECSVCVSEMCLSLCSIPVGVGGGMWITLYSGGMWGICCHKKAAFVHWHCWKAGPSVFLCHFLVRKLLGVIFTNVFEKLFQICSTPGSEYF